MSGVLVIAEARRGVLREVTLESIAAGSAVKGDAGGHLAVLIVDPDPARFVESITVAGVDEILLARSREEFDPSVMKAYAEVAVDELQPSLILAGHTVNSLGFAAALAASLKAGFASDVYDLEWDGGPVAMRSAYSSKLEVVLDFPGKAHTLLTLRAGAFEQAAGTGAATTRELAAIPEVTDACTHLGYLEAPGGGIDITSAEILVSAGRGIGDGENVARIEAFADQLGAVMSASRPLVDAGWVPAERQVGQSGKTVKPRIYLALGISGAVQHLAGIQGAETVIAVNTDPQAPIFTVARYGVNADLFEVIDAVEAQLA